MTAKVWCGGEIKKVFVCNSDVVVDGVVTCYVIDYEAPMFKRFEF